MGLSKSTRIIILLFIDSAFFVLELSVGYAVHSLALVADSFHMLNDVLSLCVGLWAVKVAHSKTSSKTYTYGWQRAETLGALINGVFLVALCLSIFLEAISRFVEPQVVTSPRLVLIVGCFGLASNILGLFLFHDHGHSHGGEGHAHQEEADLEAQNNGHVHDHTGLKDHSDNLIADESGNVADILPQSTIGNWPQTQRSSDETTAIGGTESSQPRVPGSSDDDTSTAVNSSSPQSMKKIGSHNNQKRHRRRTSGSRGRHTSVDDISIHPASFRHDIIAASRLEDIESATDSDPDQAVDDEIHDNPNEESPLLNSSKKGSSKNRRKSGDPENDPSCDIKHSAHKHRQPKDHSSSGGHGHSHGDLNMRGVFLHVMGDALGNIGVIASALFIWLTDFSWRYYADPAISLIITLIILASAIPLCKAASRILLQAVPVGINVDDIRGDIEDLPGIVGCHHLHVWQLSDTKMIASLHIQIAFQFEGEGSARYMQLARAVRTCLHEHGIHSSTIQPEFCLDEEHDHRSTSAGSNLGSTSGGNSADQQVSKTKSPSKNISRVPSVKSLADPCLLECDSECGLGGQCCQPNSKVVAATTEGDDHGHSH